MTKITYLCLILGISVFVGCTEQASENLSTAPESASAEVIELTTEELEALETSVDTNEVDLGEINAENYEEALEKLEQALDSE